MQDCCILGPIRSRRLGLSLGIDLIPYKTCSMNCVYCECGRTTCLTIERKEYFPTDKAIFQLEEALKRGPLPDYVTFSGAGEPTLHTGIGKIIDHIRENHPELRICVLTNATLLDRPEVIDSIFRADLIIPSLDASCEKEFILIDRPESSVRFSVVANSIAALKKKMSGQMWLEIFLCAGINDSPESAERFAELIAKINPDQVQLNTLDRPGTENWVGIPGTETLQAFAERFSKIVPTVVVGGGVNDPERMKKHLQALEKAGVRPPEKEN